MVVAGMPVAQMEVAAMAMEVAAKEGGMASGLAFQGKAAGMLVVAWMACDTPHSRWSAGRLTCLRLDAQSSSQGWASARLAARSPPRNAA